MQSTNFISTDILFFLLSQFLVCTPQEENDAHVASIVSAENAARKENDYYSSALQFLAPVNNKLTQKWTLWRDPAFVAQSKQLSEKEYFETLENLGIFSNMDSFCEIWNAQMNRDPEGKSPRENFLLFRDNIKPTWEDPNNTAGGKWTLTVADPKLAQEIWLSLITAMVYNQLDIERDHLCGAVLSVRPWGSLISLWNRDSTDYRRIVSFTNTLCKIFHLKAKDVRYVVHRPAYHKKPAAVPNNPPEPSSSSFSSSSFRNTTRLVDISNVAKPHKVHQVAQKAHGNNNNNSNGRYESASGKKRQQRSVRPALNLKPTKKEVASEGEVVVVQSEQQAPNAEFGQSLFDLLDEKSNVKEIRLDSDSAQKIEAVPLPAEPVEQPKIVVVEEQKPVECAPLVASSPVVVDEKPKPEGFKWRGLAPSLLIASTAVVSIAAASAMYLM